MEILIIFETTSVSIIYLFVRDLALHIVPVYTL